MLVRRADNTQQESPAAPQAASQISAHANQLGDQVTHIIDNTKHWLQTGPLHLTP